MRTGTLVLLALAIGWWTACAGQDGAIDLVDTGGGPTLDAVAPEDGVAPDDTGAPDVAAPDDGAAPDDSAAVPDTLAAADTLAEHDAAAPDDAEDTTGPTTPPEEPFAGLPVKSDNPDFYDETGTDDGLGAGGVALRVAAPDFAGGPRWRLTWHDEFGGPRADEDPACYTRHPQCMPRVSWPPRDCPAAAAAHLADLNKCNWAVYTYYNYMNGAEDAGRNVNAFDWSEVRVADGQLILGARSRGSSHTNCGRWYDDPAYSPYGNFTTDCAFISGGVESRPADDPWNGTDLGSGDLRGFDQAYGRFEVRGRLSQGPGSWPAFWMMPSTGDGQGWPGDGEIDVMESWAHNAHNSVGTFHDADPATGMHFWDGHHWSAKNKKAYPQSDRKQTFQTDWHTWAVEWEPGVLRFYVDKWLIGSTWTDKTVKRKNKPYLAGVPDYPFYWILNLTIAPRLGNWFENIFGDYRPDPDDFTRQELRIDHVRVYTACASDADFCPWGGARVGDTCDLGPAPATEHWTDGGRVWARAQDGACPPGSTPTLGACLVHDLPDAARPWLSGGRVMSRTACAETTLQERCANPCAGVGAFDGYGCMVGIAPNGLVADLERTTFFYRRTWVGGIFSNPDCLPEHPRDGGRCIFGEVPAGRAGFVTNSGDDGKFYLEPVCNPTANLPNCVNPCPAGGRFDGLACRLRAAPSGTQPFVWSDSLYYAALTDDPATACSRGGGWDGANCHLEAAPAPGAFVAERAFYLPPACGAVPWANATGR